MNTVVFRGLAQPQLSRLSEDLALLEFSDPGAVRARLSTNGFALLADRTRFSLTQKSVSRSSSLSNIPPP
jgi:hypothetical protein